MRAWSEKGALGGQARKEGALGDWAQDLGALWDLAQDEGALGSTGTGGWGTEARRDGELGPAGMETGQGAPPMGPGVGLPPTDPGPRGSAAPYGS
ncbi:hypothetical protein EYF80_059628 [Liparis tanakae]|uniref:Uncharacterized protein n=1 Tax=Liparis tanakae TaxID=230148 RepID=A0A4Z2ENS7_9TELE|nr:hypothetical protein EYF80_059628 [Liparis tanakae]